MNDSLYCYSIPLAYSPLLTVLRFDNLVNDKFPAKKVKGPYFGPSTLKTLKVIFITAF
jgi:hypothetical protein